MKIYMLRHGKTKGNGEYRYVGRTDEGVTDKGQQELAARRKQMAQEILDVSRVYASPMLRCRQTARIFFPDREPVWIENLRECDFGEFEYKNYEELNGDPDYQRFIDTMGESGFPGGEDMRSFQERCVRGFQEVMQNEDGAADIALVVHGGTIMALLDRFSEPHRDYYDWQVKNGCGYRATVVRRADGSFALTEIESIGTEGI